MGIPGATNPLLLASQGGYQVSRSLRFNSADSAYLSRTPASAGNRKTWTFSAWIKRGMVPATIDNMIFSATGYSGIRIESGGTIDSLLIFDFAGSFNYRLATTQVFRDPCAWYHLVFALDTTQATASNRLKLYINGSEVTQFSATTYPSQNYDGFVNAATVHNIGRNPDATSQKFDGYLADIHFIDGQALTPSSFGETNSVTGQWVPKAFSGGSYGTNGWKLTFSDNSNTTATTLGKDTSGNGNNWTPNNFAVTPVNSYQITGFDSTNGGGAFANSTLPASGNGTNAYHFPRANGTYTLSKTLAATSKIEAYCYIDGTVTGTITANGGTAKTVPTGSSYAWQKVNLGVTSLSSISVAHSNWTSPGQDFWLSCFIVDDVVVYGTPALAAGNDSLVDTPTSYGTDTGAGGEVRGNYATLNPLDNGGLTLANGNLDSSESAGSWKSTRATIGISSGKWYWEVTATSGSNLDVGISKLSEAQSTNNYVGVGANGWGYIYDGKKYNNGTGATYGATYTNGDVIGVAFDADNGTLTFYKNGSTQGQAYSGLTSGPYFPAVSNYSSSWVCNFGQRPWAYTPPANHRPLVDTCLSAPVVAKPSTFFDINLSAATQATRTVSGFAFSPDLVISKNRTTSTNARWGFIDSVRGVNKTLASNLTNAEVTSQTDLLTAFNSDGFTLGADASAYGWNYNQGGNSQYVYYAFDAGSNTVSNTQGSITSSCRTNQSSGFSVVTYSGNNTTTPSPMPTVGHGLNIAPSLIISKSRNNSGAESGNWFVWHSGAGTGNWLRLNTTDAAASISASGGGTMVAPTSTVFSTPYISGSNISGNNYVAYCFAPVAGYSSFGSYVGNGSATDGPFVYTGFRPRWVMIKSSSNAYYWIIYDAARDAYNAASKELFPNDSLAETVVPRDIDFLSNGFKLRNTGTTDNQSGATYIYAAFAEAPFQYARAR